MSAPTNVRRDREVAAHVRRTERWTLHLCRFMPRGLNVNNLPGDMLRSPREREEYAERRAHR